MADDPESRRQTLYSLLGDLPARDRPISSEVIGRQDVGSFTLETLSLDLNGVERVPALLALPSEGDGPFPAILYNHAHGGDYVLGKSELVNGHAVLQDPPYAEELARRGIASLCIDHWAFGERRGKSESEIFKEMLWRGAVMWGMMAYDSIRALDYLEGREEVDGDRIGTLGISMGSTMAWWIAALDRRVRVCVDICCLTDFDALIESRGLDGHGLYYFVPALLKDFSAGEVNALIAPRPHLSLAGDYDPLTPPKGLDRLDTEIQDAYRRAGAPEAWKLKRYPTGHFETVEMRREILKFLDTWL